MRFVQIGNGKTFRPGITENGTGFQITGSVGIGFDDSCHPAGTGEAANLSKITAERRRINIKPDARKRDDNT
jgi:hypothetical protein